MGLWLIWGVAWQLSYHNLCIIHFSLRQVCLFDIVCGVKGKTTECSECGDMFFFCLRKKPYHPRDLVLRVFCRGKKPYHPRDPLSRLLCSKEWYVIESHVSITYAKWTYFLVNVLLILYIIYQHRHNNHLLLGNKPMQWRFHQNPILKSKTGFISCIYQFCYFCSKARTVRVRERHTAIKSFLNFHISTVT